MSRMMQVLTTWPFQLVLILSLCYFYSLISPNPPLLEVTLAKMSRSLQTMNSEIQSLKKQVEAGQGGEKKTEEAVELHQCWKESIKGNFYTTDWTKLGGGKSGWVYKGVVGRVFSSPVKGTVPFYRFQDNSTPWKDKRHCLYTTNEAALNEGLSLQLGAKDGDVLKGICCYIFPSPVKGTKPLFRYYSETNNDQIFTTDWEELEEGKDGYVARGVSGYVY